MMCPVRVIGNPGMLISHTCVNSIFLPSGRLTVSGFFATLLFSTSTPSMTKMGVAPVSATAKCVVIVLAFRYFCFELPYILWATAANDFGCECSFWLLFVAKFDVTIVTPSSYVALITLITSVGSGK